ncbi:MAG TPA: hypothetical protein VHJ20_03450 [Polyangia bacterium]|nr:hypothetical protein [Polyangia bacterium]
MLAVIRRKPQSRGCAAFSIAGRPLIFRQLQILRHYGFEQIVVETRDDGAGAVVEELLVRHPVFSREARAVRTTAEIGPRALIEAAGWSVPRTYVVFDEATVGGADPTWLYTLSEGDHILGELPAPPWWSAPDELAEMELVCGATAPAVRTLLPGWGLRIDTPAAALRLGCAVLAGLQLSAAKGGAAPVILHAADEGGGVWIARGARVERGATLVGPVLVGPDAVVCSGARVGPHVEVGAGAIIEPDVELHDAFVEPDTIVGEGLTLAYVVISARGLAALSGAGEVVPLGDRLLLDARTGRHPLGL